MARHVIRIETPMGPEEAFDYMADMRNFDQWDPGVSSAELAEGDEPSQGAAFDLVANGAELRYVLVEYDRPRRVVAEANSKRLRSYDIIEVEPTEDGSVVTYDATLELKGIARIGAPIMSVAFARIVAKAADGLERALDGRKAG